MQGFRFEPTTTLADRVIGRPRVTTMLAGRFQSRLTTITATAGFGKTTALSLAIENNRLDPAGRDVWLGAVAGDDDPLHLLVGIARAFDVEPFGSTDDIKAQILDAIWAEAPIDVSLIVDDAHLLRSPEALEVITMLLADMPANGHLVLSARTTPKVPTARLRALGQLIEITENDLALDDDELAQLRVQRAPSEPTDATSHADDLPRHAATADLQLAAGSSAGSDFLWEEILSSIEEDRLTQLKRCAIIEELDDELVHELTDGQFDAAALVAGVPLIERHDDGGRRLHALLRDALASRLTAAERLKALTITADVERNRERYDVAIRLYLEAGDEISVRDTARDFVLQPILKQPMETMMSIRNTVVDLAPDTAVTAALEASSFYVKIEADTGEQFLRCAALARDVGDVEIEALALHRVLQSAWLDMTSLPDGLLNRLGELAVINDYAKGAFAHARSTQAQYYGEIETALAVLEDYRFLDPATELMMRAERLCDLARPELVGVGLTPDDLGSLPPGAEFFIGYAMWLRGDATPELAAALAAEMTPSVLRRGFKQASVGMLGVGAAIALANGDYASARRQAQHAAEISATGVGATIELFSRIATASLAACTDDDAVAAELLDPKNGALPCDDWPHRAHFLAIPLLYLTRPETRKMLDDADFGPSISFAVAAGQCLVAMRSASAIDESRQACNLAAKLPWNSPQLLQALVLPHHLAELACAAVSAGSAAAQEVLDLLPDIPNLLRRVSRDSGAHVANLASDMLGERPSKPDFELTTTTLGKMTLRRNGDLVTADGWIRRSRVRELWALLLERRRLHRFDVLELMWPSYEDDRKAATNLRSTLSALQGVLEPARAEDSAPFFLTLDHEHLAVADGVRSDADVFDDLVAAAQADDNAGLPGRALDTYRQAIALYQGDYLDGIDAAWAVLTRLRLRSLAVSTACRIAELTAAKGEPEEAARMARRAQMIDERSERAGRVLVAALDASGDRSAARGAATHLTSTLRESGIELSTETARLFARVLDTSTS